MSRSPEALRRHYEIERELADRLRESEWEERARLYSEVYDELFRRVPDHPQNERKASREAQEGRMREELRLLQPFLSPGDTYVEIGAGDCALAFEVARQVSHVHAIDVSAEIAPTEGKPPNFDLIISDGRSIPVAPGSADVVFSDQLMEHLHPDDAREQLRQIHAALRPGGRYVFITPNRLSGPHDISMFFDDVPTGFHLREYTNRELVDLLRETGFSHVQAFVKLGPLHLRFPVRLLTASEALLERLGGLGRRIGRFPLGRKILGCRLAATR
ncbi:MAG: class I SAM-dependent methyltransferase [Thermoleophilaceae bacterium]